MEEIMQIKRYREHYRIFYEHPLGTYTILRDNHDGSVIIASETNSRQQKAFWLSDGRLSRVKPNEYEPLDHFVERVQNVSRRANKKYASRRYNPDFPKWIFKAVARAQDREIRISGNRFIIRLDGVECMFGDGNQIVAEACLKSYLDGVHFNGANCFLGFARFKRRWIRDDEE